MIKTKQDLHVYLEKDSLNYSSRFISRVGALKYFRGFVDSPISDQTIIWSFIKTLRYAEYWMNQKKGMFSVIFALYYMRRLRRLSRVTGFQIPIRCVGKGLTIWHWGMIIINEDAQIGDFCTMRPGIVIGHKVAGGKCPVIGNHVEINSGARIIGDITIGDDVIIAPNAVVTHDVPAHSVVAGVPARIIKHRDSIDGKWELLNLKK